MRPSSEWIYAVESGWAGSWQLGKTGRWSRISWARSSTRCGRDLGADAQFSRDLMREGLQVFLQPMPWASWRMEIEVGRVWRFEGKFGGQDFCRLRFVRVIQIGQRVFSFKADCFNYIYNIEIYK